MYLPRTGHAYDIWCFEGYYTQSSNLFYTFFNPISNSMECTLSYSYSYIGGEKDGYCYLGSDTPTKTVGSKSALTIHFEFTSINEQDAKIQRKYVILYVRESIIVDYERII